MALKTIKLNLADIDTSGFSSYNGHDSLCMCVPCLSADIDAAAGRQDIAVERIADGGNGEDIEPTRTRYLAPGTKCGNGVVRTVSPAQVRYMKGLLAERDTTTLTRLPGSEDIENMSLAGARHLIDQLLSCPMKPVSERPAQEMASEAQKSFILSLVNQKGAEAAGSIPGSPTKREAREIITRLKSLPNKPVTARIAIVAKATEVTEGMYLKDGVVYKVQTSKSSGRLYALELNEAGNFEYSKGAIFQLTPDHRMTLEEAKAYGKKTGSCCVCARELTRKASIEAGIGPICAGRL